MLLHATAPTGAPQADRFHRNWSAERARLNDPARARLTTAERVVLDAIEVHIADHEEGWPTQKRIALQTGLSERQVRRCAEVLERRGLLLVRVVLPGGALPSGKRTESVRLVYRRGPQLQIGPPTLQISTRTASPTPPPHPDTMSGCHPDTMSGKGSEISNEPNTPLPPREPAAPATPRGPRKCGLGSIPEETQTETKTQTETETEPKTHETHEVLAHWRAVLWPELRGRLETPSRVRVVRDRLADGFTAEELCWTVDAATEHEWLQAPGQRHRLTVEVLFGKAERVGELAARGRAKQEAREQRARNLERARAAQTAIATAPRPERVSRAQMVEDMAKLFGAGCLSAAASCPDSQTT